MFQDKAFRKKFVKSFLTGLGVGGTLCGVLSLVGGPVGAGLGATAFLVCTGAGVLIPIVLEFKDRKIQYEFETTEVEIANLVEQGNLRVIDLTQAFAPREGFDLGTREVAGNTEARQGNYRFFHPATAKPVKDELDNDDTLDYNAEPT